MCFFGINLCMMISERKEKEECRKEGEEGERGRREEGGGTCAMVIDRK